MQISISNTIGGGGGNLGGGGGGFADTTSFLLDQVDDRLETTTNFSAIDGTTNFTISMWIKVDSLSATQRLFRCDDTSRALFLYGFIRTSGQIDVWSQGSGSNWSRTTAVNYITVGSWFHITMVLDSSAPSRYNKQRIYVNSNQGYTSNYYTPNIGTGAELSIGGDLTGAHSIDGNVNEFAVWGSTALTQAQIDEVYNSGSANDLKTLPTAIPPTNWWRSEKATWLGSVFEMDDEMGTGLKLITRNMAEASRVNDVPPNPFVNLLSTSFDGVDDYVDTGITSTGTNDISVSCWIKTSQVGVYADYHTAFGGRSNGGSVYDLGKLGTPYGTTDLVVGGRLGTTLLNDGAWHHLVTTFNYTTKEVIWYVDGVVDVTTTYPAYITNFQVSIGYNGFSGYYFEGNVDECAYFTRILDASDVTTIYNSGVPSDISAMSGLVSFWRMGDGSTYPTINDEIGSNDGTLTNMSSANFVADVPT